ncbi:MAG: hypothetical protein K9W46_05670 [Candidatus Heimdallarchaeum endolithica]|uniref:Uncharacterized protein n=1 Tax=Candidatus Heimdallarchaeum endolithica TaxID=2876572 RepID=A0A9Y1FQ33_9ARCH|nr:MAG: hypothetical protein K9W46_05670 [Candidatus Heimdallarchaeum endolithica]
MPEVIIDSQRQKIQRLIRDLNIRYIKGSVDRRTYQILKQKYQKMLESLPHQIVQEKEVDEQQKSEQITKIQEEISNEISSPVISKVKIPSITLSSLPDVVKEELRIRYVMHLALNASSKIFQEELEAEKEYISGKISNEEYLEIKNLLETKQHKIFQNYYKLSDSLEELCRKHIFKRAHNNFLLFTNELSENLNRLRGKELDKFEVKGIIYEINNSVLRHRPILQKAIEETKKWLERVKEEKELFLKFKEENISALSDKEKDELKRKIRQLDIYIALLEEDLNDFEIDLKALDEVYGSHLEYQEMVSPLFSDLNTSVLKNLEKYNRFVRAMKFEEKITVCSSVVTRNLDYAAIKKLNSLWNYINTPAVSQDNELIGFVIGPGKLNEDFGVLVYKQTEVSLSTARRVYDYFVAPNLLIKKVETDEEKKLELLNEIPVVLPTVPFNYLVPDVLTNYCMKKGFDLSQDLLKYLKQPEKILFVPIDAFERGDRKIHIKTETVQEGGEILPNFDLKKSNNINKILLENDKVIVQDIFNNEIGQAYSLISHPRKGHFLIVKLNQLPTEFYARIYDLLSNLEEDYTFADSSDDDKKWKLLLNLSREYEKSEADIEDPSLLKKILVEKNTGILPHEVENEQYVLFSIGTLRIIGNNIQVAFCVPSFSIDSIFDLEGKVVENVKGKEIGVIYTVIIEKEPSLLIWSKIDLLLIASFISDNPVKLLKERKDFVDNLAISIGKYLSLAPQVALRPDNVIAFLNLIGKINTYDETIETIEKFEPAKFSLERVISIDDNKVLIDVTDKDLIKLEETQPEREESEESFVASPDYYLNNEDNN